LRGRETTGKDEGRMSENVNKDIQKAIHDAKNHNVKNIEKQKNFKIVSRLEAVSLAFQGKDVYQINLDYLSINNIKELYTEELIENADIFYVVREDIDD